MAAGSLYQQVISSHGIDLVCMEENWLTRVGQVNTDLLLPRVLPRQPAPRREPLPWPEEPPPLPPPQAQAPTWSPWCDWPSTWVQSWVRTPPPHPYLPLYPAEVNKSKGHMGSNQQSDPYPPLYPAEVNKSKGHMGVNQQIRNCKKFGAFTQTWMDFGLIFVDIERGSTLEFLLV